MIELNPSSETFLPITDDIDSYGVYQDIDFLISTASARIYRLSKAGKTMLFKRPLDDSGRKLDLLKREYEIGRNLTHPNIVATYAWEAESPIGPGVLMEYVDGRTLSDFISERPSNKECRRVISQLLEAVNYIHKHGVIHNDLKPSNILISRVNNDVKLIDFGLADVDGETLFRKLGGTTGYASPELMDKNASVDTRSDIYSLGCIFKEIFGNRYRSIWKRCKAQSPHRRYSNIDSLIKAWRWRQRFPMLLGLFVSALMLGALAIAGALKINQLNQETEQYSTKLASTEAEYKLQHANLNDSIATLNAKLNMLNRSQTSRDSLGNAYSGGVNEIINKYKVMVQGFRCYEESVNAFKLFHDEMDEMDSVFLISNPQALEITEQLGAVLRLKGANELDVLAKKLPQLTELGVDPEEYASVLPLILSGKPWQLKSDSIK